MRKSFTSLLCTSRRKNSFNNQTIFTKDGNDEAEERLRPIVHTKRNIKKRSSVAFMSHLRVFYHRISNGFRRTTHPVIQHETSVEYSHNEDFNNFWMLEMANRSPPQITWKHSWNTNETKDALLHSPFSKIPTEIVFQIFQLLSINDLGNVSLVCRQFKIIIDQDEIWKSKCKTSMKLLSKSFKEIYIDWNYEKYLRDQELEEIERDEDYMFYIRLNSILANRVILYPVLPAQNILRSSVSGFNQHPNSSQRMTINLSVDIDKTLPELISLFKKATVFQEHWHQPSIIHQMIMRYYRFLKLKSLFPKNIFLVPTLDIEIVWQTHLTYPKMYRTDCLRLFGGIIDHSLLLDDIGQFFKEQAFIETCQLYEEYFGEKYCSLPIDINKRIRTRKFNWNYSEWKLQCLMPIYSYWDETYFEFTTQISNDYENPFSFTESDIINNSNWFTLYTSFMFEMQREIDRQENSGTLDLIAMSLFKKSYERFLYMAAKHPSIDGYNLAHSTYAIEIVWRSHMQEPLKYESDCHQFVGYVINHVETLQMTEVNDIWKFEFNNDIATDYLYMVNEKQP